MILKQGTEILVKAKIVSPAQDDRPEEKRGYVVETNRKSRAYVDPQDIFVVLTEQNWRKVEMLDE